MTSKLPINLNSLLRQRTVEGDRIEYKAGWNPDAIIKTLCAFANDFENLGGGYVIIGQDCDKDGRAIFPPVGVKDNQLDKIQRELLAYCNLIQPPYFPILSVEVFEGRNLLVLWVSRPAGRRIPERAENAGGPQHWHSHNSRSDGEERLSGTALRYGRRPHVFSGGVAGSSIICPS
jgi:ATP-dependent DNA helicase RecG